MVKKCKCMNKIGSGRVKAIKLTRTVRPLKDGEIEEALKSGEWYSVPAVWKKEISSMEDDLKDIGKILE